MKRKKGLDWKRLRNETIAFVVFVFFILISIINWQEHEDMKKEHERNATTATVYDKTANNFLFSGMSYIALLEPGLTNRVIFNLQDSQYAVIPKKVFDAIEDGDTIKGFSINGEFMTENELKSEYKWFYIILCFILIYPVGYIIYLLFKLKRFEAFLDRHDAGLGKVFGTLFWGGVIVALLVGYFNLGEDLKYGYEKYFGNGYIETEAIVTDRYADYNYERYAESYFYVAITFDDRDGNPIQMTKEVTRTAFDKSVDRQFPIKYNKENPYDVYAQKTTFKDTINIVMTNTVILYFIMMIISALLIFTLHLMNRKRKTGSYHKRSGNETKKV